MPHTPRGPQLLFTTNQTTGGQQTHAVPESSPSSLKSGPTQAGHELLEMLREAVFYHADWGTPLRKIICRGGERGRNEAETQQQAETRDETKLCFNSWASIFQRAHYVPILEFLEASFNLCNELPFCLIPKDSCLIS